MLVRRYDGMLVRRYDGMPVRRCKGSRIRVIGKPTLRLRPSVAGVDLWPTKAACKICALHFVPLDLLSLLVR